VTHMSRRLRPLVAVALAGVIALIGVGCGSSASSANGTGSDDKKLTGRDKAVKFAECMRAHGVPHFPDPDPKGDFNFGVDVSKEVFTKAVDACKALQPPGSLSGNRLPSSSRRA
jgi:hypothetical protein